MSDVIPRGHLMTTKVGIPMIHMCITCLLLIRPLTVQADNSNLVASEMKCDDKDGIKFYWNGHCIPCPKCNPGYGLNETCGYGDGKYAQCERCLDGTFSDSFDYRMCLPCQVCSNNVQYHVVCTPSNNTVCGPCEKGFYKDEFGNCITCAEYQGHKDCEFTTTMSPPLSTTTRLRFTKQLSTQKVLEKNIGIPTPKMIRVIQDEDDTGEYHMLDYKPDPLVLAAVILPCIACLFMIILMIVLLKKNSKQKFLKFCHFGGDGEKQSASHSGTTADGGEATIKNEAVQYNAVTQNVNDAYTRTPDTLRALGATPVNNLEDGDKPDEIEPLLRLGVTGTNNDKPHSDSDEDTQRQSQNRDGIYAQTTDHDESTNAASTNPAQSSGLKGIQSAVVVADVHYPGQPNDPSLIDSAKKISLEEKMKLARGVPLEDLLGNYTVMDKINGLLTPESETNSPLHIKSYRDLAIAVGMPYINVAKSARHVIEYIKASSEGDRDVSTLMKGLNTIKSFDVMDEVYAWLLNRQKEKT